MRMNMMLPGAAIVCFTSVLMGQSVDPVAKTTLEETIQAIKDMPSATMRVQMSTEGMGKVPFNADLKVKLIRGKTADAHSYQMMGTFEALVTKDSKVQSALLEGKTGQWIDDEAKTLFIRPLVGVKSDVATKVQTPTKAFDQVFLVANPFEQELKAPTLTMEKPTEVNGEQCQVIKAVLSGGNASRLIYVSSLDKLPRKYEQVMGLEAGKQQIRRVDIKDLNTETKLTLKDIELKLPEGYKTDKVDAPPPPPPAPKPTEAELQAQKERQRQRQAEKEKEIEREKQKNEEKEKNVDPSKKGDK